MSSQILNLTFAVAMGILTYLLYEACKAELSEISQHHAESFKLFCGMVCAAYLWSSASKANLCPRSSAD